MLLAGRILSSYISGCPPPSLELISRPPLAKRPVPSQIYHRNRGAPTGHLRSLLDRLPAGRPQSRSLPSSFIFRRKKSLHPCGQVKGSSISKQSRSRGVEVGESRATPPPPPLLGQPAANPRSRPEYLAQPRGEFRHYCPFSLGSISPGPCIFRIKQHPLKALAQLNSPDFSTYRSAFAFCPSLIPFQPELLILAVNHLPSSASRFPQRHMRVLSVLSGSGIVDDTIDLA